MTKRHKDKRQKPNREFDIAMSGQFRNLAMFLILPDLSGWRMNASHIKVQREAMEVF